MNRLECDGEQTLATLLVRQHPFERAQTATKPFGVMDASWTSNDKTFGALASTSSLLGCPGSVQARSDLLLF